MLKMETSANTPNKFPQPEKNLLTRIHLGVMAETGYLAWGDSDGTSPFPDFIDVT